MSTWEKRFAARMNALHHTSSGNFDDLVTAEIHPAFESVKPFITSGGFSADKMKGCENIRHYRFTLSKEMFIDLYFTRKGPCEVSSSFQLYDPFAKRREAVKMETIPLADVTEGWARQQFEVCLDEFLSEVEAMIGTGLPVVLDENSDGAAAVTEAAIDQTPDEPQADAQKPTSVPIAKTESAPDPTPAIEPAPTQAQAPTEVAATAPTPKPVEAPTPAPAATIPPAPAPAAIPTTQKQDPEQAAA